MALSDAPRTANSAVKIARGLLGETLGGDSRSIGIFADVEMGWEAHAMI